MTVKIVRDGYAHLENVREAAHAFERRALLNLKLQEELDEALAADDASLAEELADLVEVAYAIGGIQEVEGARLKKLRERGGFELSLVMTSATGRGGRGV